MKKEEKKMESLEEIVFRHRNKAYGAYQLHRDYRKFVTLALIIALFVTSAVVSYPLVTAMYAKPKILIPENKGVDADLISPPAETKPKPEIPEAPEPEIERIKFLPPLVVDSAVEENFGVQDDLKDKPNTDIIEAQPAVVVEEVEPQVIEQPIVEVPRTIVTIMPSFPGGEPALREYLATHIKFPDNAKELGIQGMVFINFIVEKDGSITGVTLLRGIGGGCDEVALQAIREMPKWNPGSQQGILVRVSFNLPVRFTLQ